LKKRVEEQDTEDGCYPIAYTLKEEIAGLYEPVAGELKPASLAFVR